MFKGSIIWRGIIYALLMIFGKLITGIWLVRFSLRRPLLSFAYKLKRPFSRIHLFCTSDKLQKEKKKEEKKQQTPIETPIIQTSEECTGNNQANTKINNRKSQNPSSQPNSQPEPHTQTTPNQSSTTTTIIPFPPKPKSLYPPSILGLAMVARGEVGYLIASLAQSQDRKSVV